MGDTKGDGGGDELPVHTVYLSAFYIDKYEVTKAQWDGVYTWALAHGYGFDNAGSGKAFNHPVQTVDWYDCVKWCNARSENEGLVACYTVGGATYKTGQSGSVVCNWSASGYRLPTEAEWEKAARGGLVGKRFPWGNTISQSQANYYAFTGLGGYDLGPIGWNPKYATGNYPYTSPVGSFAANGYGLYDMAGNVSEWCNDWYGNYGSESLSDPTGPTVGAARVVRGGVWRYDSNDCRVSTRVQPIPSYSTDWLGFRCVRR